MESSSTFRASWTDSRCMCQLSFMGQRSQRGWSTLQHAAIGRLWYGIDVGGHLVAFLAPVHVHDGLCVDGQVLVGVDDHAEEPWICLGKTCKAETMRMNWWSFFCYKQLGYKSEDFRLNSLVFSNTKKMLCLLILTITNNKKKHKHQQTPTWPTSYVTDLWLIYAHYNQIISYRLQQEEHFGWFNCSHKVLFWTRSQLKHYHECSYQEVD